LRQGSTSADASGSFNPNMSVRYDLLPKCAPASAGHASFGIVERMLAATNDPRS
jgi:hypothetical protein